VDIRLPPMSQTEDIAAALAAVITAMAAGDLSP
jgi:hypothetical protein